MPEFFLVVGLRYFGDKDRTMYDSLPLKIKDTYFNEHKIVINEDIKIKFLAVPGVPDHDVVKLGILTSVFLLTGFTQF